MATTWFTTARRFAGIAITLLFSLWLCGSAAGQGVAPLVTASSAVGMSHPSGWGAIQQTAIDMYGNWLVVDYANGAVYEFPAGGGAAITLSDVKGLGGGYQNPGIAIDPGNNLYLEANWNNCLLMFPWDPVGQTWTGLSTMTPANPSTNLCTSSGKNNSLYAWAQYNLSGAAAVGWPGWFQPWGIAIGNNNNIIIGTQTNGQFIFSLPVSSWTNPQPQQIQWEPINGATKRPISVAQDQAGNVYLVEDSGGPSGVYEIPFSATVGVSVTTDAGLTRVDPNLPSVTGVITDSAGNLYISDSTDGVVMVPNTTGTPDTADAVLLTSIPAQGEVSIDWTRHIMYVPTTQKQTNGESDVAMVDFGFAEFGASPVGTAATAGANVSFGFNGAVTPAKFTIVEDGVATPDFAITGGTCTTGTAYAALSGCLQNISFTPTAVGSISANLLMLDAKNNVLASIVLHGTGTGANALAAPGVESAIGGSLKTPSQVAVDGAGNTYVADVGLGNVMMFPAGAGAGISIGAGLTAPSGVAVDGSGDVFIADSGNVYEIPYGPSGLNTAGQSLLVSGLGSGLNLATDGVGTLYIADPTNARVVKLSAVGASTVSNVGQTQTLLTTGFTAPSAVAADTWGNLYVIDGSNLFELKGGSGTPSAMLTNLTGANGLAVDPSGSVYLSTNSGASRIPLESGALVMADETAIAADVTSTASVALDRAGNTYLISPTGGSITAVSVNGTAVLSAPASLTSSTSAAATITNSGNAPLLVTGYTSTNAVDYLAADGTCIGDSTSPATGIAAGGTCQVDITFNPGPGEQGTLTGQIGLTTNAVNSPVIINATGTGLALASSATAVKVDTTAEVVNSPLTVTVTHNSGAGAPPSGQVTVSYPSWTVVIPSSGSNAGIPTINPITSTVTGTLDATGTAKFQLAPVLAGSQAFTVAYNGDRVYGRSTGTINAAVAKSAITNIALPVFPDPSDVNLPFVPGGTGSGTVPYDGTENPWQYQFKMAVNTLAGVPTGQITMMDDSSVCPAGTSTSGIGIASCVLTGYKGVACPQSSGSAQITIQNAGTVTGAQGTFPTTCLWNVPQGTTYSPVIYTHSVTPIYSGDANFLAFNGPAATLFQSLRGPLVQITQTGNTASATAAPSLSVSAGSSASISLTLTSILGYGFVGNNGQLNDSNFPVSLNCNMPIPHAQCAVTYDNTVVDPNQVTAPNSVQIPCPTGANSTQIASGAVTCTPGHATITVYTDVSVGTTTSQNVVATTISLAAIFGFGIVGLFLRRRSFEKSRKYFMIFLIAIAGALAVAVTACSTTNLSPEAKLSSPAGTYAMSITAEEVGSQCISHIGSDSNCTTSSGGQGILVYASENQVSLPFYVNVTVQ